MRTDEAYESPPEIEHLTKLFTNIRTRIARSQRTTAEDAHVAGKLLVRIKAALPRGQWLPWLGEQALPTPARADRNGRERTKAER